MIATTRSTHSIHRRPIGYMRELDGERCILLRYTPAGHPQYRRQGGGTITLRPRKRRKLRVPRLFAKVMVIIDGSGYRGIVIKRSPFLVRVNERGEFYGNVFERPRYVLAEHWSKVRRA